MSSDKEQRLLRVVELLAARTDEGSLEWDERFGNTFQAVSGNQTLVLERPRGTTVADVLPRLMGAPVVRPGASLEIRNKKGEVVERIQGPDSGMLTPVIVGSEELDEALVTRTPTEHTRKVKHAVNHLYDVVINRKETASNAAINELLENLQGGHD